MKKDWEHIYTVGGAAALCAGVSSVKDYRNMKRMGKNLDPLPLHKLKERLSDIQEDKEKTVLIVPEDISMLERLRVYRHVLHGNIGSRDAYK